MLLSAAVCFAQARSAQSGGPCGEVVTLPTHDRSTTRYAYVPPPSAKAGADPITLVLLAGGSGHLDLDEMGCPRALRGNSLVRSIPLFGAAGFGTALVDAPSDHHGEDGLGGFRIAPAHADDLARVIGHVRSRAQGTVWVVGTSRGAISAVNAASRLTGAGAGEPDGIVITSALMAGQSGARKSWVAHSVFDLPLENIRMPLLVVGHAADTCIRSPANLMGQVVARTRSVRSQVVTVTGGPGGSGRSGIDVCEGRTPHGYVDQEDEVAAGIARFVRGGTY
jgi:hypothetical protein